MMVTKSMFAVYLGVSLKTAAKYYSQYIELSQTKRNYLTKADIARVDSITLQDVETLLK
ncbi:hypothetical protein [Croceivirga radicis]|uniref:hypothetical protein n=1 Tax=Croceivirga radicis TaxID=1929488 RepID=UPI001595E8CD|nr:hypothetical protein [Croceivirga radicis]